MAEFMSLKDHVYQYISNEISQGKLKPEEKIKENIICEELKISRTPVREALIQLTADGVLENIPRKGFVVKKMDEAEAAEIYMIIGLLDGFAARLACPLITDKVIADLELYISYMDMAIEKDNLEMYYKNQEEFHDVYLMLTGNHILANQMALLKKKFLRRSYIVNKGMNTKEVLFSANDDHRKMVEMFKEGKAAEIEAFVREVHWNPAVAYMEMVE